MLGRNRPKSFARSLDKWLCNHGWNSIVVSAACACENEESVGQSGSRRVLSLHRQARPQGRRRVSQGATHSHIAFPRSH